jgi:hypothetical protein
VLRHRPACQSHISDTKDNGPPCYNASILQASALHATTLASCKHLQGPNKYLLTWVLSCNKYLAVQVQSQNHKGSFGMDHREHMQFPLPRPWQQVKCILQSKRDLTSLALAHILPISHHAWGKDTARIRSFHVYKRVGFGFPLIHHSKVKPLYRQSTLTKKTKDNTAILFGLWICDGLTCHLRRGKQIRLV